MSRHRHYFEKGIDQPCVRCGQMRRVSRPLFSGDPRVRFWSRVDRPPTAHPAPTEPPLLCGIGDCEEVIVPGGPIHRHDFIGVTRAMTPLTAPDPAPTEPLPQVWRDALAFGDGDAVDGTLTTCPMCATPVRIVGDTTMHYEPLNPAPTEPLDVARLARALSALAGWSDAQEWHRTFADRIARAYAAQPEVNHD